MKYRMLAYVKKIYKTGLKVLLVVFVLLTVINLFFYFFNQDRPTVAYNPVEHNRKMLYNVINDPKLKKTSEGRIQIAIYRTLSCAMIGEGCSANPEDGNVNFNHSMFGYMSGLISTPLMHPPASGVAWAMNGLQNAGFVPQTYAAEGIGFAALKPIEGIWRVMRDASYLLIVLFFILVGFMIMFRMKLNPQTVISVENSLPRVVISLLLITFSFAISGFMIDLMYVLIAVIISLLGTAPTAPGQAPQTYYNIGEFQNKYLSASPGMLIDDALFPKKSGTENSYYGNIPLSRIISVLLPAFNLPASILDKFATLGSLAFNMLLVFPIGVQLFFYIVGGFTTLLLANLASGNVKTIAEAFSNLGVSTLIAGFNTGGFISAIIKIIGNLVIYGIIGSIAIWVVLMIFILFTIVFLFFRLFFMLLNTYIRILFLIMFSPLFMLYEAIPGRKGFSSWLKNMLAELLTFPLVTLLLVTSYILVNNITDNNAALGTAGQQAGAVVGLTNSVWAPPFLYGLNQSAYAFLVGMGTIFIIPQIVKMMKEMLGVKKSPINIGLGTFVGSAGVVAGGATTLLTQYSAIAAAIGGPQLASKLLRFIPGVKSLQGLAEGAAEHKQAPANASAPQPGR